MENAAHTLSGLVLARLGGDRHGPWATTLLVTAANFPDIDCLSLLFGQEAYLRWHHGVTHSLPGIALAGPLLGWSFWRLARHRRPDASLGVFVALAFAGLGAHLFLDALITYGMRPWLPFDATWYYGDVVFVVDPWIWILFGIGAVLGGPRRGPGILAWALFAVATTFVAWYADQAPSFAAPVLGAAWACLLAIRRKGWLQGQRRRLALGSLTAVAVYLACLAWLGPQNHARGAALIEKRYRLTSDQVQRSSATPSPCRPWQHRVIVQTADDLFVAVVDWCGGVDFFPPLPRHMDDPRLAGLEGHPSHVTWQQFARHPFTGRRADGALILGDGRYSWEVAEDWCNLVVP